MATRETRSKREWLDSTGADGKAEDVQTARFVLLAGDHGDERSWELDVSKIKQLAPRMCAVLGFHTKLGNVANTALHSKEPTSPADAIDDFIEQLNAGVWVEKSEGLGSRVNKDALAQAIAEVMAEAKRATFKDGAPADQASVRQRLEEDTKGTWGRGMRNIPDINNAYVRIAGVAPRKPRDLSSV